MASHANDRRIRHAARQVSFDELRPLIAQVLEAAAGLRATRGEAPPALRWRQPAETLTCSGATLHMGADNVGGG